MIESTDEAQSHGGTPPGDNVTAASSETAGTVVAADDLPEYEPLTPELVEEEAIRGDFVMRWFVVLLAILLGCTQISDTSTLLHLASGRQLAQNGIVPASQDTLSFTAAERSWTNLSWLFDLKAYALHAMAGSRALSVMAAVLSGLIFVLLVHTAYPDVSTWWGSICAALAALACFPALTAQPGIMTLLGLMLTLWIVHTWKQAGSGNRLWLLVPLFVLWSNFDPRMFLGLGVLLLYGSGEAIGNWLGRSGFASAEQRKQFWIVTGACVVAALLNPFGWKSLLAPMVLYGVEYPAWRSLPVEVAGGVPLHALSLFDGLVWQNLNVHIISGLLLLAAAAVTLVLNRRKADPGAVGVCLGCVIAAIAATNELPAAALVCCVIATLNGQAWYRDAVRQEYSVAVSELLFSRGGRAVTVLAMFAVAYLAASGWLTGSNNRRTGWGFDSRVQALADGLKSELGDSYDDRPFHFTIDQGNALAFAGQRSFIDDRLSLFASGSENLLTVHSDVVRSLEGAADSSPHAWKEVFDRFQITHAVPDMSRLNQPRTAYLTLANSQDWQLAKLGAVSAVLYRRDLDTQEYKDYLDQHRVNFVDMAFREPVKEVQVRAEWPQPRLIYERYLSLPRVKTPNSVRIAQNYLINLQAAARNEIHLPIETAAAIAYLAIRHANEALVEDAGNAKAQEILGDAYQFLAIIESQLMPPGPSAELRERRMYQSVCAIQQSLITDPQNSTTLLKLFELYRVNGRQDLALQALDKLVASVSGRRNLSENEIAIRDQAGKIRSDLSARVEQVKARIQQGIEQKADVLTLARMAYQLGCPLYALELLEQDSYFLASNPAAQVMQARLLLEAGRAEEAFSVVGRLEGLADKYPGLRWRWPMAISFLANGNYPSAINRFEEDEKERSVRESAAILGGVPLVDPPRNWPLSQTGVAAQALYRWPVEQQQLELNVALSQIEAGETDKAKATLEKSIEQSPDTAMRQVVLFYLSQLTGKQYDLQPPSDWIPVTPDLFGPEAG